MAKWETTNELDVEDPEDMMEFSAKDLKWIDVWGNQVAVIPYHQLEDFISGEQSREGAPTQFVVKTRRSIKEKDIKDANFWTYLECVMGVSIYFFQYIYKILI